MIIHFDSPFSLKIGEYINQHGGFTWSHESYIVIGIEPRGETYRVSAERIYPKNGGLQ